MHQHHIENQRVTECHEHLLTVIHNVVQEEIYVVPLSSVVERITSSHVKHLLSHDRGNDEVSRSTRLEGIKFCRPG